MKIAKTLALAAACAAAIAASSSPAMADEWTGQDKAKHLAAGAAIGAAGSSLTGFLCEGCSRSERFLVGLGAGALAGAAKEGYDAAGHGDPSAKDFAVTAVGAALGAAFGAWVVPLKGGGLMVGMTTKF